MLLFDDIKKLEKATSPEAAEAIAHVLEKQAEQNKSELATKHDVQLLKQDLKMVETALKGEMRELESRLIIKLGVMIASSTAIIATLLKLF